MKQEQCIVHLGCGSVGSELLSLYRERHSWLKKGGAWVGAVADKNQFSAFPPDAPADAFPQKRDDLSTSYLQWEEVRAQVPSHCRIVLVDATAAPLGALHEEIVAAGGAVVTANKKPLTGPFSLFQSIHRPRQYFHETTVASATPVIQILHDMRRTGDEVEEIMATLSGTLGFVCTQLAAGASFSAAVREAYERGYTEPHPRDDLSGMDVARKALILAREIGMAAEMESVRLQGLVPDTLAFLDDVPLFLERIAECDAEYAEKVSQWKKEGKVPHVVARISRTSGISVGMEGIDGKSALGRLQGPDNMIVIRSRVFQENPLVLQGRGAGPRFTAEGVFADLMRALASAP